MKVEDALRDVSVLVADEQTFRRDYVAQVLRASGATVIGPFEDDGEMRAFFAQAPAIPQLAYIGCGISPSDPRPLVQYLAASGLRCVALCSHGGIDSAFPPGTMVLRGPLAAFQVVDALVTLHRECRDRGAPAPLQ